MNVTIDNIRLWAYDQALFFREQDEELLLHQPEFIPVLIELAAKDDCPKQEFIKSILEYYLQWCFLYQKEEQLILIKSHIQSSITSLTTQWLVLWNINFQYIYGIYQQPQRLTNAACDKIANDLLIGDYTERVFTILDPLKDGSREYSASTSTFKRYFYINPSNGRWKIAKYGRLLKFEE